MLAQEVVHTAARGESVTFDIDYRNDVYEIAYSDEVMSVDLSDEPYGVDIEAPGGDISATITFNGFGVADKNNITRIMRGSRKLSVGLEASSGRAMSY